MPNCGAINCSKQQFKGAKQSFHAFPHSHPDLLKQWVINMHREGFKPSKRAVVCSEHFEAACFDRTGQTVRLRPGSIPTIFTLPQHLAKVTKSRKLPKPRLQLVDDIDVIDIPGTCADVNLSSPVQSTSTAEADHAYVTKDSLKDMKRKMDAIIHQATVVQKQLNLKF